VVTLEIKMSLKIYIMMKRGNKEHFIYDPKLQEFVGAS
jgi:hypothetical protein